ncbi:hypothetical protein BKA23_1387 [Rudaeicoccus suwonensis]|uniref:Uncharacterized protein n=1 Tax=Rudaeicoccus suwonensis TaxID=657409 RepID=A0A561EAD7_9MICO|nr:hypothetical protein BKA23_1387 [Rudaeicoccus suwonensis]
MPKNPKKHGEAHDRQNTGSASPPPTARRTVRAYRGKQRHISVRGELRSAPDVQKIARAVITMAMAQAEAEAQQQAGRAAAPGETAPLTADSTSDRLEQADD